MGTCLRLTRYSPVIATLQSAMTITTEVATLRLVMARERAYDVQVLDDGSGGQAAAGMKRGPPLAGRASVKQTWRGEATRA